MFVIRILLTLFVALTATACGPRYVDYFPYHDDGTCKPCVAFVPVKNTSECCLPWDITEELTQECRYRIMDRAEIFLMSTKKMNKAMGSCSNADYFGCDLSFAKSFCNCDFVVATEVIEHCLVPYKTGAFCPIYPVKSGKCNNVLTIKVRLRVIDVRNDEPCVVLQEIVQSNHMISRDLECYDYCKSPWGAKAYCRTPYGLAHQRLAADLVKRIECATWQAK